MDEIGLQNPTYMRSYYAGKALIGLLANPILTPTMITPQDIQHLNKTAFGKRDGRLLSASEQHPNENGKRSQGKSCGRITDRTLPRPELGSLPRLQG